MIPTSFAEVSIDTQNNMVVIDPTITSIEIMISENKENTKYGGVIITASATLAGFYGLGSGWVSLRTTNISSKIFMGSSIVVVALAFISEIMFVNIILTVLGLPIFEMSIQNHFHIIIMISGFQIATIVIGRYLGFITKVNGKEKAKISFDDFFEKLNKKNQYNKQSIN